MNYFIDKNGKVKGINGTQHSVACPLHYGVSLKTFLKTGVRIKCSRNLMAIETNGALNRKQYHAIRRLLKEHEYYILRIYIKKWYKEIDRFERPIRSFSYVSK